MLRENLRTCNGWSTRGGAARLRHDGGFGQRIADIRTSRGFTQVQVATWLGVTARQIGHIERGRCDLPSQQLRRLADLFDCQPGAFFEPVGSTIIGPALPSECDIKTMMPEEFMERVDQYLEERHEERMRAVTEPTKKQRLSFPPACRSRSP